MSDETTSEHVESETKPETRDEALAGLLQELFDIGRAWARHGLSVGKHALETSARTLELTADSLGRLADRIEHRPAASEPQPERPSAP